MSWHKLNNTNSKERFATNKLKEYMELERNYKDIYSTVKDDLVSFGNAMRLTH